MHYRGLLTMAAGGLVGCMIPILAGVMQYSSAIGPLIPIMAGVAGILVFCGLILLIIASMTPKSSIVSVPYESLALPQAEDTRKLPLAGSTEIPHSVIERTTDLLKSAIVEKEHSR